MPREFINIALPTILDRVFSYHVDFDGKEPLVGRRALVPFGKRILTGVIVDHGIIPETITKGVLELLDEAPIFSTELLKLTKWVAEYYLAPWGETLKSALPPGMSPHNTIRVELLRDVVGDEYRTLVKNAPKRLLLLDLLKEQKSSQTVQTLQDKLNTDSISAQLEALEAKGIIRIIHNVEDDIGAQTKKAVFLNRTVLASEEDVLRALDKLELKAKRQAQLLSSIVLHYENTDQPLFAQSLIEEIGASRSTLDSLAEHGYVFYENVEIDRSIGLDFESSLAGVNESALSMNAEQQYAYDKIYEAIVFGKYKTFLLHGVTGSGKTLVYLQAIRSALAFERSALVLVPEIALTPQLVARFRKSLNVEVGFLHSKMLPRERYDTWRNIKSGKIRVVLGTRSAVFAPLQNLGLIIVDEEHEPSYKQEQSNPHYNARDTAVYRAFVEHCPIVLGSATPSLESMFNAQSAKYHLLEIQKRADSAELPSIRTIDLKSARAEKKMRGSFSLEALNEIEQRIISGEQVLVFQNRRGFSSWLECYDCGHVPTCINCSVSLTFHKQRSAVQCHYCGYSTSAPAQCSQCGNLGYDEVGTGTERIEDELRVLLEERGFDIQISRMDYDTTRKRGSLRKLLEEFNDNKIQILVGTQMIAKGFDFGNVTLVVVVNADISLHIPDFRANERTFQLLTQVSGRAGRRQGKPGEVLIQTMQPKESVFRAIESHSYELFYADELQNRRKSNYSPFSRFIALGFHSEKESTVEAAGQYVAKWLASHAKTVETLGPVKPRVDRIRNQYRRLLILKGNKHADPSGAEARSLLHHITSHAIGQREFSKLTIDIDIDSYTSL